MRILHIDTEMTWRGGENQIRYLLEGLKATDIESDVAVRPGSAAAERLATTAPIVSCQMRGGVDPRAAWHLARHCREHDVRLIDAHTSNAHSLGLMIKALYSKPKQIGRAHV